MLATKPRTPPQVQPHLTLVMSRQLDDLEPTLARHGHRLKAIDARRRGPAARVSPSR